MAANIQRIKEIFLAAVEQTDPGERDAYLRQACGEDTALRRRLDGMLRQHEQASSFLEQPIFDVAAMPAPPAAAADSLIRAPIPPAEAAGTLLGPYKLLQKLGEGGMGTVWMAEQQLPVHRLVALKLVRAGLDSVQGVARFEAERQALALMDHPHIARVFDGGTTADGRPYFVMELVNGTPITKYCDAHRLTPRQRLELFVSVCHALQHAHQKGIIHRDLKPSNVLVALFDGRPIVKVIDFGVAKAAGRRLTERTIYTEFGMVVGTLEYMSPEQAELNNHDIDTRSDVYSLGVLLYELLTGTAPLAAERIKKTSLLEMLRAIREEEPPRPSTRLSDSKQSLASIAAQRRTEPNKLRKLLRGELDWIVMKALEKDRTRRYETASDLAHDLERYLHDEAVEACPPSRGYRLRKFLRRHKGQVAAGSGILATLIAGLVGTLIFAVGEAEQRGQADLNARLADEKTIAALHQAYRAHLAAASAALQNHDVADAAHQLEEAPKELRDWEWRHLHSRLDDRSGRIDTPPEESLFAGWSVGLLLRSDWPQVGQLTKTGLRLTDLYGQHQRVIPFSGQGEQVVGLLSTRDGLRLAGWIGADSLRLWDEAGNVRLQLPIKRGLIFLSPDNSRLAWFPPMPNSPTFTLYETASGRQLATCSGHHDNLWTLAFSPDSTRIASAAEDGVACVWDAANGAKIAECHGHTSKVLNLAFRPDGTRLLTTSGDGTVRQWDPATGQPVEPPYDHHSGEVLSAVYSPDGTWIASGGSDRTVRVWQATGRQEVAVLHGHTGAITEVAFTPDGKRLVSVSEERRFGWPGDNTVGIWDIDSQVSLPVLRGHTKYVYPVAFSPDGRWIASGGWDHEVRLWDAVTGEACTVLRLDSNVRTLAFGPSGSWLATGCDQDGRLRILDVPTGRLRKVIQTSVATLLAVAVSPDGGRIAALDAGRGGAVWDVATGAEVIRLPMGAGHDSKALAYSPDGRWLAGSSADQKTVCLWDAQTHRLAAQFPGHENVIRSLAFSADSHLLASTASDRTVRIWEIESGKCQVLRGHTDEIFAAAFHPSGTRLATAGRDGAIWLWDVARGELVARLQGHTSYIWSLAFSPDGATLASASGDSTVRLWSTIALAEWHRARRQAEALRPEAERLVERLFREKQDSTEVVNTLRADDKLDEPLRHAAFRAVLRPRTP